MIRLVNDDFSSQGPHSSLISRSHNPVLLFLFMTVTISDLSTHVPGVKQDQLTFVQLRRSLQFTI